MNSRWYQEVGGSVWPVDLYTAATLLSSVALRRVGRTRLGDRVCVSTVFLVMDHRRAPTGPPVLYETALLGVAPGSDVLARYTTRAEAARGHRSTVRRLRRAKVWGRAPGGRRNRHARRGR